MAERVQQIFQQSSEYVVDLEALETLHQIRYNRVKISHISYAI